MTHTADREKFEAVYQHLDLTKEYSDGPYKSMRTHNHWLGWQARQSEIDALKAVLEQAREALLIARSRRDGTGAMHPEVVDSTMKALASINAIIDGVK